MKFSDSIDEAGRFAGPGEGLVLDQARWPGSWWVKPEQGPCRVVFTRRMELAGVR